MLATEWVASWFRDFLTRGAPEDTGSAWDFEARLLFPLARVRPGIQFYFLSSFTSFLASFTLSL
jgi:hypothetical protein